MTAMRLTSVLVAFLGLGAGPAAAQVARFGPALDPYAPQWMSGYPGPFWPYPARGLGGVLQGQAALTAATGQFYRDIQQASLTRERVRQERLVTQKQRMQAEMDYEDLRKRRHRQAMSNERFLVLDRARRFPSNTEIWSGRTLNILLRSIMMSPSPLSGPNIPLTQSTLRGLNLAATGTNGNLGLARDGGKIDWTDTLMGAPFDDPRNAFSSKFEIAMRDVRDGRMPDRSVIADLRSYHRSLCSTLDDRIAELSPDEYISSRRRLNQVNVALNGLTDRRAIRSFNSAWREKVRNVSELVAYCMENGQEFTGATAEGDRASYEAAFFALRAYERDVVELASASK